MTTTGIFQINKRMIKKCGLLRMVPGNMYVPMSSSIISQCAHLWSFRYAFNHLIWNGRENQKCVCIQKVKCKIYPCNLLVSGLLPFASLHSYILKYCFTYLWLHHVTTLLCMTNNPFKVLLQVCNNNACCESLVQLDVYLDLQGHYQSLTVPAVLSVYITSSSHSCENIEPENMALSIFCYIDSSSRYPCW